MAITSRSLRDTASSQCEGNYGGGGPCRPQDQQALSLLRCKDAVKSQTLPIIAEQELQNRENSSRSWRCDKSPDVGQRGFSEGGSECFVQSANTD